MSEAVTPAPYRMPPAFLGDSLWFHSKGSEPMPATITQAGSRSVAVSIHAPDNRGHLVKDGVRHVSDPDLYEMPEHDSGCWDYTDSQKLALAGQERISAIEEDIKELRQQHAELVKALGQ